MYGGSRGGGSVAFDSERDCSALVPYCLFIVFRGSYDHSLESGCFTDGPARKGEAR
jgi:hypothetical protein